MAIVSLIATGVLWGFQSPVQESVSLAKHGQGRSWQEIVFQPTYLVALFGAATGYGIMILGMTAAPIAMLQHEHDLGTAARVIQLHVLGMFLPSFFTGVLIARFGVLRIMFAGILLFLGYILFALSGTGMISFAGALILLGVGWNFLYIGGTTLLTTSYKSTEKAKAQAINDMVIFAVGLACSFSAGGFLEAWGWEETNLMLLPWLMVAAITLVWFGRQRKVAL
jgi:MFS family permease